MTAREIFSSQIRLLPADVRLEIATLIVNDLSGEVDVSDEWSDEDIHDMTIASLNYADAEEVASFHPLREVNRLLNEIRE